MNDSGKISVPQLCAVFFICRATALFTFIAPRSTPFSPGDRLLLFIPFCLFSALFSIPVFLVTGNGRSLTDTASEKMKGLVRPLAAVYFAALLWNAGVSTAKFELFMTTAMFPGAVLLPLTVIMVIVCVYIATKGIETIGRCCVILLAALVLSVAAIIAATAKYFDVYNLTPPLMNGWLPLLKNGFSAAARTPETPALLFIQPQINGKVKKGYFIWLAAFGVFASAVLTATAGVTGRFGDDQIFQLYTLTGVAGFGALEKADDVVTGLWVLCSVFRTAFYIGLASRVIIDAFKVKNKYLIYIISGICVLCCYAVLSSSVTVLSDVLASGVNEVIFALFSGVIPLCAYTVVTIKDREAKAIRTT